MKLNDYSSIVHGKRNKLYSSLIYTSFNRVNPSIILRDPSSFVIEKRYKIDNGIDELDETGFSAGSRVHPFAAVEERSAD